MDITRRPKGGFIIDFGVDMPEDEAALYEKPYEYVRQHVKPLRDTNNRESMKRRWWIFGEPRRNLRKAIAPLPRYIITPEVAKYRIFVWMNADIIPDHTCHVIARDDDYFFGVLHSKLHELWSLRVGNYMGVGNDPRYNSSKTFGTYPFPWPPEREPQGDDRVVAIATAVQHLVAQRDAWLNEAGLSEAALKQRTLTNLYNARPPWLAEAHQALDAAVLAAYGWPADLGDEEILARLLALNLERAARQGGVKAGGGDGE